MQIEYSLWTRDVEPEILPLCEELGIGFVAYSPLGRGILTGNVADIATLRAGDVRRNMPRFQGDNLLRTMLYEAAHSLLTHNRKWSWLKAWGVRVAQRRGMRRAIVAVARRLAVVLHRMWVDGSEFRWSKDSTPVPAVA